MPRFLCDAMLGRLARDLRLLGYDVAYDPAVDDDDLLRQARAQDRVLLTKDRVLAQRAGARGMLVAAEDPREEVREVLARLSLRPERGAFLSRCARCGGELRAAAAGEVPDLPEAVAQRHERVHVCAACGHAYWSGSHVDGIRRRLGGLVDEAPPFDP